MTVENTLKERGGIYGSFKYHARISQSLKHEMKKFNGWNSLDSDQKEALEMIAHKIARIINGNPSYVDSWHDIAGYATLIEQRLSDSSKS